MATKIKSKGTALLQSISSVYTAIPNILSIDISGEASETYDSTTLDGGTYKTKDGTGYVEPPEISFEFFWDPDDTVHTAFAGLVATPVNTNFKVTYTDSTPTSHIYNGVGFGIDKKVAPADGLKATGKVTTSGAPT